MRRQRDPCINQPDGGKQLALMREQHALKVARNDSGRRRAWRIAAAALLALWFIHLVVTEVSEKLKELHNFVDQTSAGGF